ncbi:MAG: cytochrome ubiquinol oxidase subunit I, partial [Paracoccaceae bacterium]
TNWSVFSDKAGPVVGPLMAYEVLSAFFLEAGFLGIMLFGRKRVGDRLHMFATAMVAFGTLMSATWILSVNSWMQTPAGYSIAENGQFVPEDWWEIVFNPSFPYRLVHMVLAAFLTTALVVGAVGGLHLLRNSYDKEARHMFSMAMWMLALVTPLQILAGDAHGLNTLAHQPAKVMAMEGHYDSHPDGAPLILFGIVDAQNKKIDYAIQIPYASSLILKHQWNAPLDGLDTIPDDEEPPVTIVFYSFRVMVGLGFAMLGLGLWSLWTRWRGSLFTNEWLHRATIVMGPSGFIAVLAGWITTEVGRQPYTVYGLLRTSDSLAPVAAPAVATSLIAFIVVYFAVFGAGTFYLLRMMNKKPTTAKLGLRDGPLRTVGPRSASWLNRDFTIGE